MLEQQLRPHPASEPKRRERAGVFSRTGDGRSCRLFRAPSRAHSGVAGVSPPSLSLTRPLAARRTRWRSFGVDGVGLVVVTIIHYEKCRETPGGQQWRVLPGRRTAAASNPAQLRQNSSDQVLDHMLKAPSPMFFSGDRGSRRHSLRAFPRPSASGCGPARVAAPSAPPRPARPPPPPRVPPSPAATPSTHLFLQPATMSPPLPPAPSSSPRS